MAIRVLDLFCGGGGSSWGAEASGAVIAGGIDACPLAVRTFQANFARAQGHVRRLSEDTDPRDFSDLGQIDLLLASPECTSHTCARGGRPRDEHSRLTARFVLNFMRHFRPRWTVIENVVSMRNWQGFNRLLGDMAKLGYKTSIQVVDAADFGVPQTRRRLFILCDRDCRPSRLDPPLFSTPVPAEQVIDWEAGYPSGPLFRPNRAVATLDRARRAIASLGRGCPFLVVYYGSDGSGGWQPLSRPLRTLTTLDRFGLVTWHGDEPMLRMLQPPELMRGMGFDRVSMGRRYTLPFGSRRDRIRLLGNGVCPPVMASVVEHLCVSQGFAAAAE